MKNLGKIVGGAALLGGAGFVAWWLLRGRDTQPSSPDEWWQWRSTPSAPPLVAASFNPYRPTCSCGPGETPSIDAEGNCSCNPLSVQVLMPIGAGCKTSEVCASGVCINGRCAEESDWLDWG